MEFFAIADVNISAQELQKLNVAELDRYCAEIDRVLEIHSEDSAQVYCVWGEFTVQRQLINGGLRFSLPACPNALAWTLTTDLEPVPNKLVIHCTINRIDHEPEFIESIEVFIDAWKAGLEHHYANA